MVIVIDTTELELGSRAYAQMKDFGIDPDVIETEPLDAPGKIARNEESTFLLIIKEETRFSKEIIAKILDLEEQNKINKVVINKKNESRESFKNRAKTKTREEAEKLAEEIREN
jgi:hypothetical protein